jgi:hypothetical protein
LRPAQRRDSGNRLATANELDELADEMERLADPPCGATAVPDTGISPRSGHRLITV